MSAIHSLVLGASGNLGLALSRLLAAGGERVAGTFLSYRPELAGIDLHRADIATDGPGKLIEQLRPRKVYHLAWSTNLDECEIRPEVAYAPARSGLGPLLKACELAGAHLVFMSSDGIFGDPDCERFEDSAPTPINHYGRGKVEAERRIQDSAVRWSILRACPIGRNPWRDKGLVNWAVGALSQGKPVSGFADSSFTPISVATLSSQLAEIGEQDVRRVLHFLSEPRISKYEFLKRMAREMGVSDKLVARGSLRDASFKAPRPPRQDLQTRCPEKRSFKIGDELALSLDAQP